MWAIGKIYHYKDSKSNVLLPVNETEETYSAFLEQEKKISHIEQALAY
jgi:hypothetical protein